MTKELVISYYKEKLDWIDNVKDYKITIYNKSNDEMPNTIKLNNIGREMQTYFYHIVNNYDNLSDWTFFTQGDPFDHVINYYDVLNDFPDLSKHTKLGTDESHFFINNSYFVQKIHSYENGYPFHWLVLNIDSLWTQLFETPPLKIYDFTAGAIFCVSKNQIQKRNKEFYEKCLKITEERELSPWEFERIISYIFNNKIK